MKKALFILMALAMVCGAFADDLAAVTIKGEASLGYEIDLQNSKLGMTNAKSSSQEYTIQLVTKEIAKSTEGSGIWGELVVKSTEAKITQDGLTSSAAADLATAKIHFGDMVAVSVLCPSLKLGAKGLAFATGASAAGCAEIGEELPGAAGFTLELALGFANVNVKVVDNGVVASSAKKFGFGADFDLKAVDGLTLYAGASIVNDKTFIAANAGYDLALGEGLKLSPAVAITYADDLNWCAGALLLWGAKDQEPGFKFVKNKCADGFSVGLNKAKDIAIGVYDSTLVAGLKMGADYVAKYDNLGKGTLQIGVIYGTDVDVFNISAHADFQDNLGAKATDYKYGVTVKNTTFVANTDLSVGYEGGKGDKGKITAAAKIHF